MTEESVIQVELDGLTYVLRGTAGEQKLRQTADLVAQKIELARAGNPKYSPTRIAMLAALQIAEEMLALHEEYLETLEMAVSAANTAVKKSKKK